MSVLLITLLIAMTTIDHHEDSIFSYEVNTLTGTDTIDLSEYQGKVILAVNTASKCGFTPQYEKLQKLHEEYNEKGLVVIGFPSGDFGGQEYETNEEIEEFCEVNFGVEFPLSTKISVKGDGKHELFEYLTKTENPDFTGEIDWNFEKFLIGTDGKLKRRFDTSTSPDDEEVIQAIESLLSG